MVVCRGGGLKKYQRPGADGFQRPLLRRSRFQPPLRPGVAMTSAVKRVLPLFLGLHESFSPPCLRRGGASQKRRLLLLLAVGWVHLTCLRRVPASL
jgi:hypothetical protein